MTNESGDVAKWIGDLADPDPRMRETSALRLHRAGTILIAPTLSEWLKDSGFFELVRPFAAGEHVEPTAEKAHLTVGIAVQPNRFEEIRAANGSPRLSDVPPDQDAKEFELQFAGSRHFDILTTQEPGGSGAIAKFLQKFGEGIQQIEANVTNVDRATEILRARFGLTPIYPATRPGADGTRVNFFLVVVAEGKKCLVELVEPAARK